VKQFFPIFLLVGALGWATHSKAQLQHPVGYHSIQATSQVATFSFNGLDRKILTEKTAAIYANEPVSLTFDVLVAPNGDVKYVRPPRVTADLSDLRLACTSALYGFAFAPVDATEGEKWFKATLVLEEQ
jgi:hypothetical protein